MTESRSWREEYTQAVHDHQLAQVAAWLTDKAHAQGIPERMYFEWRSEVAASPAVPYSLVIKYQRHDRRLWRAVARAFRVPRRMLRFDGPSRLCVDGHAYHRRRKARARRRRR